MTNKKEMTAHVVSVGADTEQSSQGGHRSIRVHLLRELQPYTFPKTNPQGGILSRCLH